MKSIIILFILVVTSISGFSQNFYTTYNLILKEITESDFRHAYKCKQKSNFKWKTKGKEYKKVLKYFLNSNDAAKKLYNSKLVNDYNIDISYIKLKSKCKETLYLIQEKAEVNSQAYLFKDEIPDTTAMFGIGDIDNQQIYYAYPDYDCDQHLWCRWYSLDDGKVVILAELKDISYEYDLAIYYDISPFFADNFGSYYIAIINNPNFYNINKIIFYKVSLMP